MMNAKKNRIVIPIHPGKEIKIGLLRAILKEAGIDEKISETFEEKISLHQDVECESIRIWHFVCAVCMFN